MPGRTSTTMPGNGASSGSWCSPAAIRQRPPLRKRSSPRPVPAAALRRPAGRVQNAARLRALPSRRPGHDLGPRDRARGRRAARRARPPRRARRAGGRRAGARTWPRPAATTTARARTSESPSTRTVGDRRERRDASPAHRSSPGQASADHPARRARRRSRRSGSRSGTSRRSTIRPARPPVTATRPRRVRWPKRAGERNSNVACARSPGGRSMKASSPRRELVPAGGHRPGRGSAGRSVRVVAARAGAGRQDDAPERDEEVAGDIGEERPALQLDPRSSRSAPAGAPGPSRAGLRRSGGSCPRRPGRPRRRGRGEAAAGDDREVRGRKGGQVRRHRSDPGERGPGRREPQPRAVAGRIGPRRRLGGRAAGRPSGAGPGCPSSRRAPGRRARRRDRDGTRAPRAVITAMLGRIVARPRPGVAMTRAPPSWPTSRTSIRRSSRSASEAADARRARRESRRIGEAGRRARCEGRRRRASAPPIAGASTIRAGSPGASAAETLRPRPPRRGSRPPEDDLELRPPARGRGHEAGEIVEGRARSSGPGGSPAATRTAETSARRASSVISRGSCVSVDAACDTPRRPRGDSLEQRDGPARSAQHRERPGRGAPAGQPREVVELVRRPGRSRSRARGRPPGCARRGSREARPQRRRPGRRASRGGASVGRPAEDRDGGRGGAGIDDGERPGDPGHEIMLPAAQAIWRGPIDGTLTRPRRSPRQAPRAAR